MSNQIESGLIENRIFPATDKFKQRALIGDFTSYDKLCKEADENYQAFWGRYAKEYLTWIEPFTKVVNDANAPPVRWFDDGKLNISANCIDRHLTERGNKVAFYFEADDGSSYQITYLELYHQVCRFANGLKQSGVCKGDRVIIYMPMGVEAVVAMQSCARIGAVHSVVFGGFSAQSLSDRIIDAKSHWVITADSVMRGGKEISLKQTVDQSLQLANNQVKQVIVYRRTSCDINFIEGRDKWWHELIENQPDTCEPEPMNAEDPLFILYTSGSTGKPKGILHTSAGYLLGAISGIRWAFDYKDDDVFWCTADVGWITGHTYVCYGPMACGATQVVFEGVPTYPSADRFWQLIEKYKVSIFYTAPTAIRSLIKLSHDGPAKYDLSSLRLLATVGEPINPEAWMWYYEQVGQSRCPIIDTWWQTETGSMVIAPIPAAVPQKPGSCTLPLPGHKPMVIDEQGNEVAQGSGGYLVLARPWPSSLRGIWGDQQRYLDTYFPKHVAGGKYYVAGDSARTDDNGYFWMMGRIDDVLNVSGHRLGTMEIESALVAHPKVVEAAVVAAPDELTGEAICAFVVTTDKLPEGEIAKQLVQELRAWVGEQIGPIAKPKVIRFGENLPKTRSGKIMRRLLRSLAKGEEISQDTSTLENPAILEQLSREL